MPTTRGFFGKLPARGDFVSAGLPRSFVSSWDAWISDVLPTALTAGGDDWLQAPVWRFNLAPDVCGIERVDGLLFPSIDRVGRPFPLTLAWIGEGLDPSAAKALGRAAIEDSMTPAAVAEGLAKIGSPGIAQVYEPAFGSLWWTDGDDSRHLTSLPDAQTFAMMLTRRIS